MASLLRRARRKSADQFAPSAACPARSLAQRQCNIRMLAAFLGAAFWLASCSPSATPMPVTLTPPVPTVTAAPVNLVPATAMGSKFTYADGTVLVAVPNGEFIMGHGHAENPEHEVILSDYWIYSTEVTNRQYALCVDQGWCTPPDLAANSDFVGFDGQNKAVVGVTHDQASDYCNFVGGDLPTEAQWEKAARGTDGRSYPWGDATPTCELLNFGACTKQISDVTNYPKGQSVYGTMSMAGNVYEWVADWYDPLYYASGPAGDPPGPLTGQARVIRSSGFRSTADQSLSYARSYGSPNDYRPDLGFRCVVQNPSALAPACQIASSIEPARMAGVVVNCPEISIDVQVSACRYGGGAVVTFNDSHAQDPNASFGGIVGCTLQAGQPGSYPLTYECRQASTAVLSTSCTYSGIPPGDCPRQYELDATSGVCTWTGARPPGIDCPAGEFYDPVQHCCRITSGELVDFPVCTVGTVFTETADRHYACLPSQAARKTPETTAAINPPVCGDTCELTVELCSLRNLVFCPTTCSCLAVGRKCPEP